MCYHVETGATKETEYRRALLRVRRQSKRTVNDNHAAKHIVTTAVLQLHEQSKLFLQTAIILVGNPIILQSCCVSRESMILLRLGRPPRGVFFQSNDI